MDIPPTIFFDGNGQEPRWQDLPADMPEHVKLLFLGLHMDELRARAEAAERHYQEACDLVERRKQARDVRSSMRKLDDRLKARGLKMTPEEEVELNRRMENRKVTVKLVPKRPLPPKRSAGPEEPDEA